MAPDGARRRYDSFRLFFPVTAAGSTAAVLPFGRPGLSVGTAARAAMKAGFGIERSAATPALSSSLFFAGWPSRAARNFSSARTEYSGLGIVKLSRTSFARDGADSWPRTFAEGCGERVSAGVARAPVRLARFCLASGSELRPRFAPGLAELPVALEEAMARRSAHSKTSHTIYTFAE
jgi:hypothetical protein